MNIFVALCITSSRLIFLDFPENGDESSSEAVVFISLHGVIFQKTEVLECLCSYAVQRSWWQRVLSGGSAAIRLLGLRVRIPLEAWMSVACECCVLSGRGLCDGRIRRPGEFHRVCVSLSVVRRISNPLHLQWVGRQEWNYKFSIPRCRLWLVFWIMTVPYFSPHEMNHVKLGIW